MFKSAHAVTGIASLALLSACARNTPNVEAAGGSIYTAVPATGRYIPAGTTIDTHLDQTLTTSGSHVGDRVTATVQSPLIAQNGDIAIPVGSKLVGTITGLAASSGSTAGAIRLNFNRIEFGGRSYGFSGDITRVEPKAAGVMNDQTVKPAVTGVAAGTAISLGRGDVSDALAAGSTLEVRTRTAITP